MSPRVAWAALRMRSSRRARTGRPRGSWSHCFPTGSRVVALRKWTNRCGLAVLGQRVFRWSSQAAIRWRTAGASGIVRSPMASRESRMSASMRAQRSGLLNPWKMMSAPSAARAGSSLWRILRSRSTLMGRGSRLAKLPALRRMVGLTKMILRALRTLKMERRPMAVVARPLPLLGSAARTSSREISRSDCRPSSAHDQMVGRPQ